MPWNGWQGDPKPWGYRPGLKRMGIPLGYVGI